MTELAGGSAVAQVPNARAGARALACSSGWPDGDDAAQLCLDLVAAREHVFGVSLRIAPAGEPAAERLLVRQVQGDEVQCVVFGAGFRLIDQDHQFRVHGLLPPLARDPDGSLLAVPTSAARRAVKAAQHPRSGRGLD